jgi:glycosyltransferase involved in cell wall biosynthesis
VLHAQRQQLLHHYPHLAARAEVLLGAARRAVTNSTPNVSVVVTCKNKSTTLEPVMGRLAKQSRRPDLVVLSDDNSDDDSISRFRSCCARLGLRHAVTVLPPGGRYRLNTVRNRGFLASLDGLVLVIDADMVPSPLYVEAHLAMHRQADRPILSVGPRFEYAFSDGSGPVNFMWGNGAEGQALSRDGYIASWSRGHGAFGIAKGIWEAIGRFDETYNGSYGLDDIDFFFRLFLGGVFARCDFEAYVIHIPHATYFEGGGRETSQNRQVFCRKYEVDEAVLTDPLDFSALGQRQRNWATDYAGFLAQLDPLGSGAAGMVTQGRYAPPRHSDTAVRGRRAESRGR